MMKNVYFWLTVLMVSTMTTMFFGMAGDADKFMIGVPFVAVSLCMTLLLGLFFDGQEPQQPRCTQRTTYRVIDNTPRLQATQRNRLEVSK